MSSLDFKNFLKDSLRTHGSYTFYPFLFGFHPEFTCEKFREFGKMLKSSHSDFKFIKYSENSGGCVLKIGENPFKDCNI
jgi:hypothetical protein